MEKSLLNKDSTKREIYPDKVVDSVCPFCGVGCQTLVSVKDNKILSVNGENGPANENRLCVIGRLGFDYIKSPQRLTNPLIRISDKTKSWDLSIDEKDIYKYFRKASWEEALDLATNQFTKILKSNKNKYE